MSAPFDLHAPGFTLRIGGRAASDAFLDALSGWRVYQQLSRPSICELTLHDASAATIGALALGDACELSDLDGTRIFTGAVTSIRKEKRADGLRVLTVRAHDALEQLRRRQALAVRRPDTLAGLVSAVVAPLGVDVDAYEDGPRLPLIVQWGANDLDWLANLCAAYGKYFFLEGGVLRLMSLHGSQNPAVELDPERDLFEAAILSNAVGLRTEARACAWNPLRVEAYAATVIDLTLDAVPEWQRAPAELKEVARDIIGGAGPQDEDVVSRVAQADLERAAMRAHAFDGLAEGNPRLMPGTRIVLGGADDAFQGEFVLTRVEHAYTPEAGFTSAISSEAPPDPVRLAAPGITLGVVIDTDDPDDAGRVRVRLKAFNDVESDWLNVMSLGAGEGKGFVAQPEEGDNVLVAFVNDNPAQGVVLGGLFGAYPLHDRDVARARPRPCSLRTRDGQQLRLDDAAGAVTLTSRGGVLDLDPDGVVLETRADLRIAAPGRRITIVADKIDFKRG